MTLTQYALNLGLLALILGTNLGTRQVTLARLVGPLALVAAVAWFYLGSVPTSGNDTVLEGVGVAAGLVLGVVAGLLVRVREHDDGVWTRAGWPYASLWVVVIGGRMLFAYGADHWFTAAIGRFSYQHAISGADAWTAAFVLMAVSMVVSRVLVTGGACLVVRRGSSRAVPA